MEHDEESEATLPDLEAVVARNVRRLRDARRLSQQQLGSDLAALGAGMHQTTVAKLEAGTRPLRLNEAAAIAAYFKLPIRSLLWDSTGETLDQHEVALRQKAIQEAEHDLLLIAEELRAAEEARELAQGQAFDATRHWNEVRKRKERLEMARSAWATMNEEINSGHDDGDLDRGQR